MGKTKKTIGDRIADARTSRGVSQEKLAEAAGVSRGTIQNIEYGTVSDPGIRAVAAIALALATPIETLAGIDVPADPETEELLRIFRNADPDARAVLLAVARRFAPRDR